MAFLLVTGRAGAGTVGCLISTVPTLSKQRAFKVVEEEFRRRNQLASNIALHTSILLEGSEQECHEFSDKLFTKMKEEKNGNSNPSTG